MTSGSPSRRPRTIWPGILRSILGSTAIRRRLWSLSLIHISTHYGGEDERFRTGERWRQTPGGVAHFLEHKMFDMPGENALQTLSARGASANAFTGNDMTGYYFSCTDQFYENLHTLLSFVTTPYFTEESVAKEQGIIGQEIQMCIRDRYQAAKAGS